MTASTSFGTLLKRYRQAAGLSQEALAARAGVSARAISDLERGINRTPRYATLALVSGALKLSVQQQMVLQAAARPEAAASEEAMQRSSLRDFPLASTALIGRERERTEALARLRHSETRLLTLTGPSGVGKTRLALELSQDLALHFSNGVVYVPLTPIRDAGLVPGVLAEKFGICEQSNVGLEEQLCTFLHDKHLLLVLDNVEQVLDCAPFVAKLLERCPRLFFLVTSRRSLQLRAEQVLTLAPLPLEKAVALFCERAQTARPGETFAPSAVAGICEQVDRLPLAIELAAVHVKVLSLADLRQRLTHRLALLRGGTRDLPARQQTMEDAIAWSYELLTAPQQRGFRALGVFRGGWTLEAAEAVCAATREEGPQESLLVLEALVEASLIQAERAAGDAVRFGMLQLIQEYAVKQLSAANEEDDCRRRHAAYYAGLAEMVHMHFGPGQGVRAVDFSQAMAQELPNARAALEWAEAREEAELGLRLTGFARLWHVRGQMSEAERWFERMLALDRRARAQNSAVAPLTLRIRVLFGLGRTLVQHGKADERAEAYAREALDLAQSILDHASLSEVLATLGMIAQANGKHDEAEAAFAESLVHARLSSQHGLVGRALMHLADVAGLQGDVVRATTLAEEALADARARGMTWDIALLTTRLGHLARQQQDYALAKARYREALTHYRTFGSPTYLAGCLAGFAAVACAERRHAQAARLCAAAAALREQTLIPRPPAEAEAFEQVVASARAALGTLSFDREWATGTAFTQEAAINEALEQ
jgi:predicted ATPase/DNA-binding XRE family transcriptional regulator